MFNTIQTNDYLIFPDSGSARDLIFEATFRKLSFKLPMVARLQVHVIGEVAKSSSFLDGQ